jgi:hypothetical protein
MKVKYLVEKAVQGILKCQPADRQSFLNPTLDLDSIGVCVLKPDLGNFKYSKMDSWIAVAYEEGFFVGTVSEVKSECMAVVQFLTRGARNVFRWPTVDDIAPIQSEFVFAYEFEVSSTNGQTYRVPELNYIEDLYEEFSSTFFVDIDF